MKKTCKGLSLVLALIFVIGAFSACSSLIPQKKQLIAKWMDSNKLSGYEFFEDGKVEITYANFTVPIVNIPFNGTVEGVYTTSKTDDGKNRLTITFTIFTKSLELKYDFEVDGSSLKLTDPENGNTTVYIKQITEE